MEYLACSRRAHTHTTPSLAHTHNRKKHRERWRELSEIVSSTGRANQSRALPGWATGTRQTRCGKSRVGAWRDWHSPAQEGRGRRGKKGLARKFPAGQGGTRQEWKIALRAANSHWPLTAAIEIAVSPAFVGISEEKERTTGYKNVADREKRQERRKKFSLVPTSIGNMAWAFPCKILRTLSAD